MKRLSTDRISFINAKTGQAVIPADARTTKAVQLENLSVETD